MVGFGYLLQTFERWWGLMNGTLSFYECRFSGGETMSWWGQSTLCKGCLNFLHSHAKTSGANHLVKLTLPIYKQLVDRVPTRTGKPGKW